MIECPYCQNLLKEASSECPQCHIDIEKLARLMGPMPAIFGGVSQNGARLSTREVKRLTKVTEKFQRRFPQSRLHLLCRSFSQEMDFKVILFWLFNKGGLSNQGNRGGKNRDIVLLIEPTRGKAGVIVGYGLEPLLSQETLDRVVLSAEEKLKNGEFAAAFETMVDEITKELREICAALPEAVGLQARSLKNKTPSY